MKICFDLLEDIITGDKFWALSITPVIKVIDKREFIEVTSNIDRVCEETVHFIAKDSVKKIGERYLDWPIKRQEK